jgi:hypothetical protein
MTTKTKKTTKTAKRLEARGYSEVRVGEARYLVGLLPSARPATWGAGILVHNHVKPPSRPAKRHRTGQRGFRVWLNETKANRVQCDCGWARELGPHHRVGSIGSDRT